MKNQRKIGPPLRKSILAEEFLDFLIGLGEFVFTEFHQGFGTFQLLGELINIEFIILHSFYDFFKLSYGLFVISFSSFSIFFILFWGNRVLFNFCLHAALSQPRFDDVARLQF